MRVRDDVAELLREGLTNTEIARRLRTCRHDVARARKTLGLPNVPRQPLSLEEKWTQRTRPVDGGHLEWTGERQKTSGTPLLRYRERMYTAARVAFRIKHGREPVGYAFADCGMQHCVALDHVDDEAGRARTREQLRYLNGGGERPERCAHGHDQAVDGRYGPDGVSYCEACKLDRRHEERPGEPP